MGSTPAPVTREARRREFVKLMRSLTGGGRTSLWRVFGDFCELAYCAVSKPWQHPDRQEAIEARYMKTVERYDSDQVHGMSRLLGMLALAVDATGRDFLGHIYEEEDFCDRRFGGQFFTPEHVSDVMATCTIMGADPDQELTTLAEPTCGSGRMIFSACRVLADDIGLDVPTRVWVEATDLDPDCAKMTYLQMAFAEIPGLVRHGNTISLKTYDWAVTPAGARLYATSDALRRFLASSPPTGPLTSERPEQPLLAAPGPPDAPFQAILFPEGD